MMQIAFWCRVRWVPIPFRRPNLILNHVFLFPGKLSFIFGSAPLGIAVFRHLPELDRGIDILLAVRPGRDPGGMSVRAVLRQPRSGAARQAFEPHRH